MGWSLESSWWVEGYQRIAGIDEAGRGALFGPLVAAAVVFPHGAVIPGSERLADSKGLTGSQRVEAFQWIRTAAECWSVAMASAEEIDRHGLQTANIIAMRRAWEGISPAPDVVVVDGWGFTTLGRQCAVIDGDRLCASVSAASIVAKVLRDRLVTALASQFPGYGLERHKGYGTEEHLAALERLGPTPLHRRSFAPVARLCP